MELLLGIIAFYLSTRLFIDFFYNFSYDDCLYEEIDDDEKELEHERKELCVEHESIEGEKNEINRITHKTLI